MSSPFVQTSYPFGGLPPQHYDAEFGLKYKEKSIINLSPQKDFFDHAAYNLRCQTVLCQPDDKRS
jgi:hypothetical protein